MPVSYGFIPAKKSDVVINENEEDILMRFCNQYEEKKLLERSVAAAAVASVRPTIGGGALSIRYLQFKPWSGEMIANPLDNGYYFKFFNGGFVKIAKGLLEENGFKVSS